MALPPAGTQPSGTKKTTSKPLNLKKYREMLDNSGIRSAEIDRERDELSSRAAWLLIRTSALLQKQLDQEVHRPAALSWSAFRVLHNVSLMGVAEPTQLANVLGLAPASVSSLLTTLTKDGYVTRTRSETNQARVNVELTTKGREKVDSVIPAHGHIEREFMASLSTEQRESLIEVLDVLLAENWPE